MYKYMKLCMLAIGLKLCTQICAFCELDFFLDKIGFRKYLYYSVHSLDMSALCIVCILNIVVYCAG